MEVLGNVQRGTLIGFTIQQQCRHFDGWKHVAKISLGKGKRHRFHPDRMELGHDRSHLIDHISGYHFVKSVGINASTT